MAPTTEKGEMMVRSYRPSQENMHDHQKMIDHFTSTTLLSLDHLQQEIHHFARKQDIFREELREELARRREWVREELARRREWVREELARGREEVREELARGMGEVKIALQEAAQEKKMKLLAMQKQIQGCSIRTRRVVREEVAAAVGARRFSWRGWDGERFYTLLFVCGILIFVARILDIWSYVGGKNI